MSNNLSLEVAVMHPEELEFVVGSCRFKMIKVEGGTFTMGATEEQGEGGTFTMGATEEQGDNADYWAHPAHKVSLSDYYIGQTEVTLALWEAVMGWNPSCFEEDNLPVRPVSWNIGQVFIKKLNRLLSKELGGKRFALPTEAQWEFAARGGNMSQGYKYAGSNNIDDVAWYKDNSGGITHPVGQKQPNELGLYDMSGNVWECCQDWYGHYSRKAQTNPQGPADGKWRVYRGGSWFDSAEDCRVSFRDYYPPDCHFSHLGLRLCLIP